MYNKIISKLESALGETIALLSSLTEKEINTVPFEGSWTAAQVGRHLYKAENGMDGLLQAPTERAGREPDQRVKELQGIFLNFDTKMKSPDFIVPEEKEFNKEQLLQSLQEVKDKMMSALKEADLTQVAPLPDGHPFEGATKLEMIHFTAYHAIRHNHQIGRIKAAL